MDNTQEKLLKDAQYRKGLSIAWFNANNLAIEQLASKAGAFNQEEYRKLRDFFLDEYAEYYQKTVAKVGLFDPKESVKRLQSSKNMSELEEIWISMSEDERQDEGVLEVQNKLKEKYA